MLLTRCPACNTTFRISEEMLRKAAGQVRCGRCSNVFNAHRQLRDSNDAPPKARAAAPAAPSSTTSPASSSSPSPVAGPPKPAPWPEILDPADSARLPQGAAPGSTAAGETPGAQAQSAAAGSEPTAEAGVAALSEPDGQEAFAPTDLWTLTPVTPPRSRLWTAAVALAGLVLLVQVAHSFSDVLATRATLGPLVQRAYAVFGLSLVPRWDLARYEVVRATATTNPGASGRGNLVISARIRNRGTLAQPYPHVQLRLLDRWEQTVGRRAFAPADYSAEPVAPDAMLDPGASITAELVVVDPGPDAAGFEIDICIVAAVGLRCKADDVFE